MSYMVKEGKLAPDDMTTDIGNIKDPSGVVIPMDTAPKSYKINGRRYTKADFKRKYAKMSDKKKKKATFDIKNDPDFNAEIKKEAGVMPTATTATRTNTMPTPESTGAGTTAITAATEVTTAAATGPTATVWAAPSRYPSCVYRPTTGMC